LYTHHTFQSIKLIDFFDILDEYLNKNIKEIVEIKLKWSDVNSKVDYVEEIYDIIKINNLYNYLITPIEISDSIENNVAKNKRVFFYMEGNILNYPYFLSNTLWNNWYVNTNNSIIKIQNLNNQLEYLKKNNIDKLYELAYTLTPSTYDIIKGNSITKCIRIHNLEIINNKLPKMTTSYLLENFGSYVKLIHVISIDFYNSKTFATELLYI